MKILHFFKTAYPDSMGGVEHVINQIAMGSIRQGISTDVLTLSSYPNSEPIEVNGYWVHRAHRNFQIASTGFSVSVFKQFTELAKKADVIHYHFPWPFMDVVHFATKIKKPTVVTYHSDIIRQKNLLKFYQPLQKKFLTSVDRIVATSPNYLKTSNILETYANKVSVIPIGIDKATYPVPSLDKLNYWRSRVGVKFFLFVGVIRYYKGLHILLEAAKNHPYPIVIVGAGPIEADLKMQARQLNLTNIHFLGQLSEEDKVALFMLCYAVVFPSHLRSEAFGISLLEGAMYGKPMISSEIGTGTTFINIADKTGLVVPPSDPIALGQAMKFLWENPEMAKKMGNQAEDRYWQLFTADKMTNAYVELYKELVD